MVIKPLIPNPCVNIIKKTNGYDANDPNGTDVPFIAPGGEVIWTYEVTNCGNTSVDKADVVVTDNQTGVTPIFDHVITGNNDDIFYPGEVWAYKAIGIALDLSQTQTGVIVQPNVCTNGGKFLPKTAYVNLGTVTIPGASANNPSSYCNPPNRCVGIKKYTNGYDADNPDLTDVPFIAQGGPVTWTYNVNNCGETSVALANVVVTDDQPGVTPAPIYFNGFVVGDSDNDNMFDPGETWQYSATGTALDLSKPQPGVTLKYGVCTLNKTVVPSTAYFNTGKVTIPEAPSVTDPSSYCNPQPCVTINKKTNGFEAFNPNDADVPNIQIGDDVKWTYDVTNCGNRTVALANVLVTDNQPGVTPAPVYVSGYVSGDLNNNNMFDPGETWQYAASFTAYDLLAPPAGVIVQKDVCTHNNTQSPRTAYINIGKVTIPDAPPATDPSSYCNPQGPCVTIVKYTNGYDADNPDLADVPNIAIGDKVTWTYDISNCGNTSVPKAEVIVTDNQGVVPLFSKEITGNGDGFFDPGEIWEYIATGTALDLSSPPPIRDRERRRLHP